MKAVLRRTVGPTACFALFLGAAACETAKSANPLSPTIAGPLEGVTLTPPKLLEPLANQQIRDKDQPFNVVIENATTTSPRPFVMRLQVATDINFSTVVWSRDGIAPGENGQARFVMPERLAPGRNYFWRAQADDGANRSDWSATQGFEVMMPTQFGVPTPRSPVANAQLTTTRPELRVANGTAQGPVAQAYYQFQVSASPTFNVLSVNEQTPQQSGETVLIVPGTLNYGTAYYWRARISDGETISDWSRVESFRTSAAPAPSPGPAPGPAPGGSCVLSTGYDIIACNRGRYSGLMSTDQILSFLAQSAKDLTAAGINGAPFGLLVKAGGNQCNGFSCDILCSGNGSGQRQWDVLGDSDGVQFPVFAELPANHIVVRPCSIQ